MEEKQKQKQRKKWRKNKKKSEARDKRTKFLLRWTSRRRKQVS